MSSILSRIKLILISVFSLSLIFGATIAAAREINLYDQPNNAAKLIGKIDVAQGVVPIISQPDGQWVKVGDPHNGNVGWIKASDMGNGTPMNFQVFRYGDANSIKNPFTQIIPGVNGQPIQDTPANMQKNLNNMVRDLNQIYQQQQKAVGNMPMIMPIIVMPTVQPVPAKK